MTAEVKLENVKTATEVILLWKKLLFRMARTVDSFLVDTSLYNLVTVRLDDRGDENELFLQFEAPQMVIEKFLDQLKKLNYTHCQEGLIPGHSRVLVEATKPQLALVRNIH